MLTITYEGMTVPRENPYYSDCLGYLPKLKRVVVGRHGIYQFKEREASKLSLDEAKSGGQRATVEVNHSVGEKLGPYALGYKLSGVDEDDTVRVTIRAERGVRTDDIDAIGVPVHSDCPVESFSLHVQFINLVPGTPPKAEVFLLSAPFVDSRPLDLAGNLDHKVINESTNSSSFSSLFVPKARICIRHCLGQIDESQVTRFFPLPHVRGAHHECSREQCSCRKRNFHSGSRRRPYCSFVYWGGREPHGCEFPDRFRGEDTDESVGLVGAASRCCSSRHAERLTNCGRWGHSDGACHPAGCSATILAPSSGGLSCSPQSQWRFHKPSSLWGWVSSTPPQRLLHS